MPLEVGPAKVAVWVRRDLQRQVREVVSDGLGLPLPAADSSRSRSCRQGALYEERLLSFGLHQYDAAEEGLPFARSASSMRI